MCYLVATLCWCLENIITSEFNDNVIFVLKYDEYLFNGTGIPRLTFYKTSL
jgi:hypothetical protein